MSDGVFWHLHLFAFCSAEDVEGVWKKAEKLMKENGWHNVSKIVKLTETEIPQP